MTNDFFNEAAWEQAWKEDMHTAVNKMKNAGIDPVCTRFGRWLRISP